jgi:hypothetical protein
LEPDQERSFERITKFLDTLTEQLGRLDTDQEEDGKREGNASPKGAASRIARVVLSDERS